MGRLHHEFAEAIGAPLFNGNVLANTNLIQSDLYWTFLIATYFGVLSYVTEDILGSVINNLKFVNYSQFIFAKYYLSVVATF